MNLIHIINLINETMQENESLASHLGKAKALAEVARGNDFLEQDETTQYNYLWALSDLLKVAEHLNEQQISHWMKNLSKIKNTNGE